MTTEQRRTTLGAAMLAAALVVTSCGGAGAAAADGEADASDGLEPTPSEVTDAATGENQASHFDADDLDYDESEVVAITLGGATASADSAAVTVDGATVTISAAGTYSLSGSLTDGEIVVDAADGDDVTLVLDGVDIANTDGAAIAVMNADEALVVLAEGTTNQLTDGAAYVFPDAETDEPNAALYSAADLSIAGGGALVVNANYNDGITSKDGLVIEAGTITVSAADDGIRGKDYVIVNGGTIAVDAVGDGIKADNEEDLERGYVLIADGSLSVVAGDDGVQGATDVLVTGGETTIDAGSGSEAGRALQGETLVAVSGGVINATAVDDAIHSNNEITIDGGTLTLASGDDGIHGDLLVTINGGAIIITDAYEGIESEVIAINDGFIDVTSSDDGLNVASADAATTTTTADATVAPGPGGGGRGGPGGADDGVGEHYIYINGGTITITITGELNEQGDGIDANGHVEMTGGVVAVSGPTDTRNSALDYSGGSFTLTGGLFIGTNIDGRNSEGVGAGSSQASLYLTTGGAIDAGTVVRIESTQGEGLVTFEPANAYSVIVFSSPALAAGESYDVYLGGAVAGESVTSLYEDSAYSAGELVGTVVAGL